MFQIYNALETSKKSDRENRDVKIIECDRSTLHAIVTVTTTPYFE